MIRKIINALWGLLAVALIAIVVVFVSISKGWIGYMPPVEELENPNYKFATEVFSEDGKVLGTFSMEKNNRVYSSYADLSPNIIHALIATEDVRFAEHSGIDAKALFRAIVKRGLLLQKSAGGGSTISQQLAKQLFTEKVASNTMQRLLQKPIEWVIAVKLERYYTKEEILTMYLNKFDFLNNAVGIKTAASTYFGCEPKDLKIEQAAMLVGMCQNPSRYNPVSRNPKIRENALGRRNVVLRQMEKAGYISDAECDSLQALPLKLAYTRVDHKEGLATYFREYLRGVMTAKKPVKSEYRGWQMQKYYEDSLSWETNPLYGWCRKNTKANGAQYDLYRDGLKIYTTINATMQKYAEKAVWAQMGGNVQPMMDRVLKGRRSIFSNLSKEEEQAIINRAMRNSDRYRMLKKEGATEKEIQQAFDTPVKMRVFSYKGDRDTTMTPRDSLYYYKRFLRASLMALDPSNGYVKAYVGGPSFRYFKYDMVKQGKRQIGSTIKPFVYTFAIEQLGLTPCTPVPNLPVTIETYNEPWSPREASKVVYDGNPRPLRWGLANSRNNYSAWIMKQARQPEAVAEFIHKFGIHSYVDPVPALCVGTSDFSLFELVGAYGTFANRGVHIDPIFVTRIEDRHGNVLANFTAPAQDAISEQTAYTMLGMLKNVINAGTAGRIRALGITADMGGKTGTTQNNSDAWFVGVTPKLVAGVWVGGEDRSIHLSSGGEGSRIALPIFADFIKRVYNEPKLGITQKDQFPIPVGAVSYDCDESDVHSPASQMRDDEFFD